MKILSGRRWKQRCRRCCGLSVVPWLGGEDEEDVPELLDRSGEQGGGCGRGNSVGGDELRSVGKREGSRGKVRVRERARRVQEMSWRCGRRPGGEEAARQGGGGRGAWPRVPGACPCPSGEGGRRQGREWRWAGPAGPVGGAR